MASRGSTSWSEHSQRTATRGVSVYDPATQRFTRYTEADGLPNDVLYGILADDNGYLWMSTNRGIARFCPVTEEFVAFDPSDGLQGEEFNNGAYYRLDDGTMYFGGINGFNAFDPQAITVSTYDPPGQYTFRVRGTNSDGVWSDNTASLALRIVPAFRQTIGFRLLVLSAIVLLTALAYRYKTTAIRRETELLDAVEERTGQLTIANERLRDEVVQRTRTARRLTDNVRESDVIGRDSG